MKKLISAIVAILCCAMCCLSLAACANDTPYYNKKYTFTGEQEINWNAKNYFDNYSGDLDKEMSQKQILEKHWDKIDFSKSDIPSASSVDDLIAKIDATKIFDSIKGFAFSFSGKEDLKLTLTLPETYSDWGFGSEITMPFAETQSKLNQIRPQWLDNGAAITEENFGFLGIGIKEDGNKAIEVSFSVSSVTVYFNICCYAKNAEGYDNTAWLGSYNLQPTLKDADENDIITVSAHPQFTLTDNK